MEYQELIWDLITGESDEASIDSLEIIEAIGEDLPSFVTKVGPIAEKIYDELMEWASDYAEDPESFEDISMMDFYDNVDDYDAVDAFFRIVEQEYL